MSGDWEPWIGSEPMGRPPRWLWALIAFVAAVVATMPVLAIWLAIR